MIDGVTQRLANYRDGIERVTALIARRAELVAALPPVRERFEAAIAEVTDRATARQPVSGAKPDCRGVAGARSAAAEQSAQRMRALTIDDPALRSAVDAYADAIISISGTEGQIADLDKEVLGTEGRADRPGHRFVARCERAPGSGACQRFRTGRLPTTSGRASCSGSPAC